MAEDDDHHQEDPNASVFQSRTYPRYCRRPRPTQTQYIPGTPRAIAAASGGTPSNSDISSSRVSSSDSSSFFFTISSSSSSSSSSLSLPQSSSSSSYRCTFRGKDAIGFRRIIPPTITREKLKQQLSVIGSIRHANVVQLIGASMSEKEPFVNLMYPFVDGPTLSDCLTSSSRDGDLFFWNVSTWQRRMDIAVGVARGLNYIHHMTGFEAVLVHNGIKTSNIIILSSSNPVKPLICKFGLAHAAGEVAVDDSDIGRIREGGILTEEEEDEEANPYMSPEVRRGGMLATRESDVYAFGVVLLELISGAEPVTYRYDDVDKVYVRKSIMETARAAVNGGEEEVRDWVDGRLDGLFPVEVAAEAMRLALYCLGEDPRSRPDMGLVEGLIFDCWRNSNKFFS